MSETESNDAGSDRFFVHLCGYSTEFWGLFTITATFSVLSWLSLLVLEPGSGSFALASVNAILLGLIAMGFWYILRKCSKMSRKVE